jgi:Family of unknown function (DUF6519)
MKGDFTRKTFKRERHYASVNMQQGRVQIDTDWNEQADLTRYRIETETVDVVGDCGAPRAHAGFHIVTDVTKLTAEEQLLEGNIPTPKASRPQLSLGADPILNIGRLVRRAPSVAPSGNFLIGAGRMYVGGMLAENEHLATLTDQPHLPGLEVVKGQLGFGPILGKLLDVSKPIPLGFDLTTPNPRINRFIAYLDVWSRHLTALDDPNIREVALGGPDTATRTQTIWQVKLKAATDDTTCDTPLNLPVSTGRLKAKTKTVETPANPCIVPESAGFRGLENQLYRIEIHRGGKAGDATWKWSRENGSVVSGWKEKNANVLTIDSPPRDATLGYTSGDWLEATDDLRELWGLPGSMVQVADPRGTSITIHPGFTLERIDFDQHAKLRRWDHTLPIAQLVDGAIPLVEGQWLDLEQGVQVWFGKDGQYQTGDYWLIPARTANADLQSGNIEWPIDSSTNEPSLELAQGIQHRYCKLALLSWKDGSLNVISDCRKLFDPLTELKNPAQEPHHVCCEKSVGKDGDFETLEEAFKVIGGSPKQRDWCLCLLPQDHVLKTSMTIAGGVNRFDDLNLKITGCGPNSQIHLTKGVQLSFQSLSSLILRDLAVKSDGSIKNGEGALQIGRCNNMTIENSRFLGETTPGDQKTPVSTLLRVQIGGSVKIIGNQIEARVTQTKDPGFFKAVTGESPLIDWLHSALGDATLSRFDVENLATKTAEEIAVLPVTERRALLEKLNLNIQDLLQFDPASAKTFISLVGSTKKAIDPTTLKEAIVGVRASLMQFTPGTALVFEARNNKDALTVLENNTVIGTVSTTGIPSGLAGPNMDQQKRLYDLINRKEGSRLIIDGQMGSLQIRGNRIFHLTVGQTTVEFLMQLQAPNNNAVWSESFQHCMLTDNVFESIGNMLVSTHLTMNGNMLAGQQSAKAIFPTDITVAQVATFVGNHGLNPDATIWFNISRENEKVANVLMTITP